MEQESERIRCMIVEDDEFVAQVIKNSFSDSPEIWHFSSAEEAIENWDKEDWEMVILDIHLPGKSGIEFCRELKEKKMFNREMPIILACTGDSSEKSFREALEAGASDYIAKPLDPQLLSLRLEICMYRALQRRAKLMLEKENQENQKRMEMIAHYAVELICVHKPTGNITFCSPSSEKILGEKPQNLIGKKLDEYQIGEKVDILHNGDSPHAMKVTRWKCQRKNGSIIWLETASQIHKNKEIFSYTRDITEEIEEEERFHLLEMVAKESDATTYVKSLCEEIGRMFQGTCSAWVEQNSKPISIFPNQTTKEIFHFHQRIYKEFPNSEEVTTVFPSEKTQNEFVVITDITSTLGKSFGKLIITSPQSFPLRQKTITLLKILSHRTGALLENRVSL